MRPVFDGHSRSKMTVRWLVFSLLLTVILHTGFSHTVYEAESASLSNGATISSGFYCSNGQKVGNIGGTANGAVTFNDVKASRAGLYPLDVLFDVKDDRSFTITVNAATRLDVIFSASARKDAVSRQSVMVPLVKGDNTITFDNAEEFGPDLDAIVVADEPVKSDGISGRIRDANGSPLKGVELQLSGGMEMTATTDAHGKFEFPFVPEGDYYVRPRRAEMLFFPVEKYCRVANGRNARLDFTSAKPRLRRNVTTMQSGKWRIEFDLSDGTADIFCGGEILARRAFAAVRLPEVVTSMDYKIRHFNQESVHDGFGAGIKFMVKSSGDRKDQMLQTVWLYEKLDYVLMQVEISSEAELACNFISPLTTQTPVEQFSDGDHRALFVPFDNDKWIRYNAVPFGGRVTSHEVSALYDNTSRAGLVLGSIEHDTWKTGVTSDTSSNGINSLEIFGGITGRETRDVLAHGKIRGATIKSPKIFLGWFPDWRDGMEAYAEANAIVAAPRLWTNGVPFGWNSWGKIQFHLNYEKAIQVSDFIAQKLQSHHFENHGVAYIGLDSGWDRLDQAELKALVEHCHSNHQEAGIYFAPFAAWRVREDAPVADTQYKYRDILLYANHRRQKLDSGTALDPTHPGTKRLMELAVNRFKRAGFTYIKVDFLTHGALEADQHFDPHVTTGMQAYNAGMKYLDELLGPDIYLNQAISPLFPSQYANSRRIACDTFGDIDKIEYTLNALTYGWWLDRVYDYNDADHVVLEDYTRGENRARVTSSVITGIFTIGDDFSDDGGASGKARAEEFLTNPEVNDLARSARFFRPMEGNTANHAANVFVSGDKDAFYLAVFNYSMTNANIAVDLKRVGLAETDTPSAKELWSNTITNISNPFVVKFGEADAALYKISRNNQTR